MDLNGTSLYYNSLTFEFSCIFIFYSSYWANFLQTSPQPSPQSTQRWNIDPQLVNISCMPTLLGQAVRIDWEVSKYTQDFWKLAFGRAMACCLLKDTMPAKENRTRETVKSRIIGEIVRNCIIMLTQNMLRRKHLRKPLENHTKCLQKPSTKSKQ